MFPTVYRCLPALDIEGRILHARVMRATLTEDIDHVVFSMLLAVRRCLTTLDVKGRVLYAGVT